MPSEFEALQSKNRNFICSCQKAYLSYAALFTHIKQKHGGKAPGQIVRPRSLNKRGRPRKNDKLASEKGLKGESYDGYYGNNNLKNINFVNELNFNQNQSRLKNNFGKGFTSYKDAKRFPEHNSSLSKFQKNSTQSSNIQSTLRQIMKQEDEDNMEFANPNNELSSNTLALASIIIGLQQLFKDANNLELVKDNQLQTFTSYTDLKNFHSKKLLEKGTEENQQDVFLLGNIICAFLNFCHQTLEGKVAYQQIVLLIVCLLQHIKHRKAGNALISCRKQVIHECLPSFFQQYLQKVIIKSKLNFWIFKQNNSFKVLIWFLNWLSAIETNYLKNNFVRKPIQQAEDQQQQEFEGQEEEQEESQFEDEEAVQFQRPTFLKQILKIQKNSTENRTLSSIQKKELENPSVNKEESQISQSVQSSQKQQKSAKQVDELQGNPSDSQINSNEPQNQNNEVFGIERISSEVR